MVLNVGGVKMSKQFVKESSNDENKGFYIGRAAKTNQPKFIIPEPTEEIVMKKHAVQTGSSGAVLNSRLTIEPEGEGAICSE